MPKVNCKICGNIFYVKPSHQKLGWGKYCSISCRSKSQIKGKLKKCSSCSKNILRSPAQQKNSKSGKFFCTKACQTKWRNSLFIGEKHSNWINGNSSYRNLMIRNKTKRQCVLCKTIDIRILSVHHIDHDRSNNKISNLTWLCLNCHYLVHHHSKLDEMVKKGKFEV